MGAPRKATKILDLKGAHKKNPQRARPNEPVVGVPFPKSPRLELSDEQKIAWHEVVTMCPAGVLTGADIMAVEIVACLYEEFKSDYSGMSAASLGRLCQEMGKLGLTPSGRAGLTVEKPKVNEFD